MSDKSEKPEKTLAKEPAKPAVPPSAPKLSLNEFCMRLSERDRRVALLGAFEFSERTSGRLQDTEAAYQARFKAFSNKPA